MERKDHYFTRGDMYRLIPSLMKPVMPGERVSVNVRGTFETDVIAALRTPAMMASYAFFVPNRIVWSGWPDFISDADTVLTIPTVNYATSPFPQLGELSGTLSALPRRAFKMAYNEFFGDDAFGTAAWYTDPTADTAQNAPLPLKTVNQLLSSVALDVDEPADNYTVAASTIELTEFRRRLKQNARQNNQRIGGEKYFDALRRYGVDMREELASRPELIARQSEIVYPQEVFNTSDTDTGARVGRYRIAINFDVRRKFCMEHGHIFVCHALRPFLGKIPGAPVDRSMMTRRFFMEEMDKPFVEVSSVNVGTATDVEPDPLLPLDRWQNLGDMYTLNGVDGTLAYAANAALSDLIYPTVATTPKCNLGLSITTQSIR